MRKKIIGLFGTVLLISVMCPVSFSDDIESEINTALEAYKNNQYSKAISSLEFATQKIREMKAEKLDTLFPQPLPGWTARELESMATGNMFLGGMISGTKEYVKDASIVKIGITSDNPMISFVSGILSNPAMLSMASHFGRNAKVEKIKGEKVISEWDPERQEGSVRMVIANRVLVTVTGIKCTKEDITRYAEAMDLNEIRAFTAN